MNEDDRWIDHHSTAIDGPVLHPDELKPGLVRLYFPSHEQHSLVAHYVLRIPKNTTSDKTMSNELIPPVPE